MVTTVDAKTREIRFALPASCIGGIGPWLTWREVSTGAIGMVVHGPTLGRCCLRWRQGRL